MGAENANKMLEEGWKPTAAEALEAGLIDKVVAAEKAEDESFPALRQAAQEHAQVYTPRYHV